MTPFVLEDDFMNRIGAALLGGILFAGCGFNCEEAVLPLVGDVVIGEFIYDNKCATCHGQEGQGVSGPPLTEILPQLTSCDIVDAVQEGPGNMPAFKSELDEQELADLVDYLTLEFQ